MLTDPILAFHLVFGGIALFLFDLLVVLQGCLELFFEKGSLRFAVSQYVGELEGWIAPAVVWSARHEYHLLEPAKL